MIEERLATVLAAKPALAHVVIGLGLQAVVAGLLHLARRPHPWWFGATAAIAFYFSRKKLEFEHLFDPTGSHKATTWDLGWLPWEWPWRYQFQFYAPAAAVILAALLAERLARRIPGGVSAFSAKMREPR